ncbi:hypothetical protein RND71_001731 [Anisodus tanguticus]|uniref:RRM domain-containing protein n=1 Tax=Anisodus tanguticus TaxID=243964 RepID=A0AAE1VYA1_9SOLA|nr:hypothetical protein RND71_001731 [Anisodus tanguticus]
MSFGFKGRDGKPPKEIRGWGENQFGHFALDLIKTDTKLDEENQGHFAMLQSRGFGFVTFKDEEAMKNAIEGMNDHDLDGRNITVNEAQFREGGNGDGRGDLLPLSLQVYEIGLANLEEIGVFLDDLRSGFGVFFDDLRSGFSVKWSIRKRKAIQMSDKYNSFEQR